MNPAICSVCGKAAILEKDNKKGDWLQLPGYTGTLESEVSLEESLHFFCYEHIGPASRLIHNPTINVIEELKKTPDLYSDDKMNIDTKSWWKKLFSVEA